MTKEEFIDNIARLNSETWRDREEVRTEIGRLLAELKKALEQQTSEDEVQRVVDCLLEPTKKPTSDDCVSRDTIRLKMAEMPKYTESKKLASIRHLEDFLEKEVGELIEATPEMCKGFTLAHEYLRDFIKALPPVTPTLPKSATIGDMITATFPNEHIKYNYDRLCNNEFMNIGDLFRVDLDTWNESYIKE